METDKPSTLMCTVVAIDYTNFCYRVCSVCEKTLPDNAINANTTSSSSPLCKYCNLNNVFNPSSSTSKRLFRILVSISTNDFFFSFCTSTVFPLKMVSCNFIFFSHFGFVAFFFFPFSLSLFDMQMSIASDTEVFVVVMFDRAARVLFGCSADEFFDFAKLHPFAAETATKILEGEMLRVTLMKPKNGNAQHQRVSSVIPLRSGFRTAIETLRELYGVRVG
ncbi:hypothetical protein U1Q18_032963 [Sarracenia purpurea var. burkii]